MTTLDFAHFTELRGQARIQNAGSEAMKASASLSGKTVPNGPKPHGATFQLTCTAQGCCPVREGSGPAVSNDRFKFKHGQQKSCQGGFGLLNRTYGSVATGTQWREVTMQTGQNSTFYRLIYQSRSTLVGQQDLQIEAIQDILLHARRRNIKSGVSGLLLYNQLEYFQMLEGSEAAVNLIFRSILHDTRHTNVVTLQRGPASSRIFHSWSMAYKELPYGSKWFDYPIHDFPVKLLGDGVNVTPGCLAGRGH